MISILIFATSCAIGNFENQEENYLNNEDPEDRRVGLMHHFGDLVRRLRRVHLNFRLMARVDYHSQGLLCVAE